MVGLEGPAELVVAACLVGHIGLNIIAIDGFAFIEIIPYGIAFLIKPFGIANLGLFAQIRFAAKRVAVDGLVDFHTCAAAGAFFSHIGGIAVFPGFANGTVCIVGANHIAIGT